MTLQAVPPQWRLWGPHPGNRDGGDAGGTEHIRACVCVKKERKSERDEEEERTRERERAARGWSSPWDPSCLAWIQSVMLYLLSGVTFKPTTALTLFLFCVVFIFFSPPLNSSEVVKLDR